ncbi:MAG: restriction endonuclease subunit S [Oscillospiraceae bacterium]|jgi:hypothetical protein|nr:restriction endonuclease subunit S [Oscillospiraceae bacterium]
MKVKDLFTLYQGNSFELMNMEVSKTSNINFVSRTSQNNGVVEQVIADNEIEPFPAGYITVALGGSVLSAFVQTKPFYTAFHIMVLKPNKEMSLAEKLYYCMCIKANAYRYNYGRQANKTLKDIALPDSVPKSVINTFIMPISTKMSVKNALEFDVKKWSYFEIGNLFSLQRGKMSNISECENGNIPLVTAFTQNNGVRKHIGCDESYYSKGNCIIVANTGQGSVFRTFYQPSTFVPSNNVTCLYPIDFKLNKYIGLFIATLCRLEIPRYSYGRIVNNVQLSKTVIKLPVAKNGLPDCAYMENYIKSLPYGDRI